MKTPWRIHNLKYLEMKIEEWPNGAKQGQTGTNGAKKGQKGPTEPNGAQKGKWGQMRPNGVIWG